MLFQAKGILDFTPIDVSKKHKKQSDWKCVAMIKTNCDISDYYAWYLKTRFNLKINPPLRGTHVTIINDKVDKNRFHEASKIFNKKEITFYYENIPRTNVNHWWLRVWSPESESIRQCLGLDKDPYFGYHLTIGITNPKHIEHSRYIVDCCKRFNLIESDIRKPLESYEIIKSI